MSMTKTRSVASVTVAYNGAKVLPRQLNALKNQTRRLDEIIFVDNASSDDSVGILKRDFPEVTILNQPSNLGVGGGSAAGLDYAANQKQHDWVWLLDQDSLPAEDSLERLLKAFDRAGDEAEDFGILAPTCANENAKLSYSGSIWRHGLHKPPAVASDQPISFVDSVIASGTLVRREAVEQAGLPRADFFMDFVDHEYCLRLRRHGYKVVVVRDSRVGHAIGEPRRLNVLGFEKSWSSHVPWREYYMTRNEIFTVWKYDPDWRTKCVTAQRLLRHAMAILLFGREKLACLTMMCRGFADGRAGRLGIRSFNANESSTPAA
jgi:GT2 family glycosyltransferase